MSASKEFGLTDGFRDHLKGHFPQDILSDDELVIGLRLAARFGPTQDQIGTDPAGSETIYKRIARQGANYLTPEGGNDIGIFHTLYSAIKGFPREVVLGYLREEGDPAAILIERRLNPGVPISLSPEQPIPQAAD